MENFVKMEPIRTFTVVPALPEKLQCLREIAYNLYWAWDHESIDLFRRLGGELWETTNHNPVLILANISQKALEAAAEDDSFLAHTDRVYKHLKEYIQTSAWYEKTYNKNHEDLSQPQIAYFSTEYGIADCMPIYSGGMGVLSGDHLKSSSDLGIPLVGVGLLYQVGYFHQRLDSVGMQQETYPKNDFYNMPIELLRDNDGNPLTIAVQYPNGQVKAQIWRVHVGRVPLFMLDTNTLENSNLDDRNITSQLYPTDQEIRIRQEIMLGIGGVRALDKLGIKPIVYHMNEGHSAFLALERICLMMEKNGMSFNEAKEIVAATSVFTTHTPVPAGFDVFPAYLMEKYFGNYCSCLRISFDELMALGRYNPSNSNEGFNMAVLALRLAARYNAVSKLHGEVSRKMWQGMWRDVPEEEIPIKAIVNGIHIRSWVSKGMAELFERYLGPRWSTNPSDASVWERIRQIPDDELWQTHERRRERLIAMARRRLISQLKRRGSLPSEINQANEYLNPDALTIGFARRFATYKRATLIFRDVDRLISILCNKERPVQIIYSGKAHPQDLEAKKLIQSIIEIMRRYEDLRKHIIFVEDYDICIARYLVQGTDLWLNTPRRMQEASGTSGMKAAINGVINMSILDGWWYEAYKPEIGWAIGQNGDYSSDENYQDSLDANSIYQLLEREVVPLFYDTGTDGLPRKWIQKMKDSMVYNCPMFNTNRMLHDYVEMFYHPCIKHWEDFSPSNFAKARELASWKSHVKQNWNSIRIDNIEMDEPPEIKVGEQINVKAKVYLGGLNPSDVSVEVYQGLVNPQGSIINGKSIPMNHSGSNGDGNYIFQGIIKCQSSGLHGYSIRILPKNEKLVNPYELGLILWAP